MILDTIVITVVAICVTAFAGWAMQRYELRQVARMFEEGSKRTQQLIEEGNKRAQEMINEGRKEFRELINKMDERLAKMDERFVKMDERFTKMDERFEVLLRAIEAHAKSSTFQHKEILEKLS
jgi:predicted nuclease with TOPRIM domain